MSDDRPPALPEFITHDDVAAARRERREAKDRLMRLRGEVGAKTGKIPGMVPFEAYDSVRQRAKQLRAERDALRTENEAAKLRVAELEEALAASTGLQGTA